MSTKYTDLWQGEKVMVGVSISKIIEELDNEKSYLYKIIEKENIVVSKTQSGRYIWNENIVKIIKNILYKDKSIKMDSIDNKISKLGLKRSYIHNRRYLGNKYSLSEYIRTL